MDEDNRVDDDQDLYGNNNYSLWGLGLPSREDSGDSPSLSRSNNSTPGIGMFIRHVQNKAGYTATEVACG